MDIGDFVLIALIVGFILSVGTILFVGAAKILDRGYSIDDLNQTKNFLRNTLRAFGLDSLSRMIRISKKYNNNQKWAKKFAFRHPISKRRGQAFLERRITGMSIIIEERKKRRRPAKMEEKPAKRRYHGRRPMRRLKLTRRF